MIAKVELIGYGSDYSILEAYNGIRRYFCHVYGGWCYGTDYSYESTDKNFSPNEPHIISTTYTPTLAKSEVDGNQVWYKEGKFSDIDMELWIFKVSYNHNIREIAPAGTKLYYLKFYQDDVLVRDFIPVQRNQDNTVGLLDLVENKFYTYEPI